LKKEWLEEKYLVEKLTSRQIANLLHVGKTSILRYLKKFDINRRPERKKIKRPYHDRNWLYQKYITEKRSTKEIAVLCGLSPQSLSQICKYLRLFDIPIRNASERYFLSHTEESRRKQSKARKKIKGWHHSEMTKEKIRRSQLGEKSHNWKGGYYSQKSGSAWNRIRKKTLIRDKNTCQSCGATTKLDVHHIIPFRCFINPREANKPNNLISLCRQCHIIYESKSEFVNTKIGKNPKIYPFVNIFHSKIGDDVIIKAFCNIGRSILGNNVNIQAGCTMSQTKIGNNVFIGPQTAIFDDKYPPTVNPTGGVIIKNNVIIGGGCIILPNVIIHQGAVIGAGTKVTKNIPPETVVISMSTQELIMTRAEYDKRQMKLIEENT